MVPQGELRREPVFLHTASNNFAPYIMHCVEVEKHVKLIVLSEVLPGLVFLLLWLLLFLFFLRV